MNEVTEANLIVPEEAAAMRSQAGLQGAGAQKRSVPFCASGKTPHCRPSRGNENPRFGG
jgi:hypothetical protein